MKIGYARVSTKDQNLDLQLDALKQAGCTQIFQDKISGTKEERDGLNNALSHLREDDVLVVWKLDRLGRSLKHLVNLITELKNKGIGFCSLKENIDTTTSSGELIFNIFASLAQFEREIIRERTQAGLSAAKARGRLGGRPRTMDNTKIEIAKKLLSANELTVKQICNIIKVGRSTFYKYFDDIKTSKNDKSRKKINTMGDNNINS